MSKPSRSEREHPAYRYGTDRQYLEWLSYQPSCIDGDFSQYGDDGTSRNIACHYRRVNRGAGTAEKPPYCAVPMTSRQHFLQEANGYTYFHPHEWWEEQVRRHLRKWIESKRELTDEQWEELGL